ncbi:RNA polymerase sigma factor [Paludisphaera mucosa]|uniref:Sigma-70 family RNA polymerase sigma factor n=1 Tax=Paludisphaera mucosa TaxID=3030827 RepID=A0ABT6FG93_9BACT|nr:sigma-70 family RNA polymerase sigma factor [Paludisphaera mucosa]MDG3006593.1 sigma-70 family RNA polymerase sigma factor [Paludisphaera mucosa]
MDHEREEIELELLVIRCQRGERAAFDELIRGWERRLFVYIRKLVSDEEEAWQLLQEIWLQVLRGITSLRQPRFFPVWVYQVARNTVMSHYRREYSRAVSLQADVPVRGDDFDGFDDAESVHAGLSRLAMPDREVLTLYFLNDLSIAETAEVLGIPPGTVKSRLYRAKRALRDVLGPEGGCHG